jgi:hypothetical protein
MDSAYAPWSALRSARSTIGATISTTVGSTVGATISTTVGSTVGPAIGSTVGPAIGSTVGPAIGSTVGAAVGATLAADTETAGFSTAVSASILNTRGSVGTAVSRPLETGATLC